MHKKHIKCYENYILKFFSQKKQLHFEHNLKSVQLKNIVQYFTDLPFIELY